MTRYLLQSLSLNNVDVSTPYLQLFLALCLGPESGIKGFVNRTRRAVYIPGETQEQRRLKRYAIQNGCLLIVHIVTTRRPDLKDQISELLDSLDDADVLLHFMVLINYICTELPGYRNSETTEQR